MDLKEKHKNLMFRAVQVSFFGNIILFVIKTTALLLVNSLAIATDLGITVAGLIVSGILYYSIKLSNQPADFEHNYGYGKVENVCEAMEGVVLIGIALAMSFQAVTHLFHPKAITLPWIGFGFSIASATINFVGAVWILALAKRSTSPAIRAEGLHYKLEGFISSTVASSFLVGLVLSQTAFKSWAVYVDPVATLVVSLAIAIPSFGIAKHAFFKLLDSSLEEEGKMEVLKQLGKYLGQCCEFRDVRSRSAGRKNFVELKLILPRDLPFSAAHRVAGKIEQGLHDNIPECEATVHIIPCDENCVFMAPMQKCPYLPSLAPGDIQHSKKS